MKNGEAVPPEAPYPIVNMAANLREHRSIDVFAVSAGIGILYLALVAIVWSGCRNSQRQQRDLESANESLVHTDNNVRKMADERAAVGELGRIAISAPDVSDIYEIFASRVGSLVPFSMLSVNLIDQNDHAFTTRYVAGDRISQHLSGSKMPLAGKLGCGVAHDFNNLLSAKLGFAQLADNQLVLDERVNGNYIKRMTTAAERSAGLVRQLLAFSRRQITAPIVLSTNEQTKTWIRCWAG